MKHLHISLLFLMTIILLGCAGSTPASKTLLGISSESTQDRPEPPTEFVDKVNPLKPQPEILDEGAALFQADCASCHGKTGLGDGPASRGLDPKPANLAQAQSKLTDAYLYWRISEGGLMDPFKSVMPAWKGILDEQQIWQVITYIRKLNG